MYQPALFRITAGRQLLPVLRQQEQSQEARSQSHHPEQLHTEEPAVRQDPQEHLTAAHQATEAHHLQVTEVHHLLATAPEAQAEATAEAAAERAEAADHQVEDK